MRLVIEASRAVFSPLPPAFFTQMVPPILLASTVTSMCWVLNLCIQPRPTYASLPQTLTGLPLSEALDQALDVERPGGRQGPFSHGAFSMEGVGRR